MIPPGYSFLVQSYFLQGVRARKRGEMETTNPYFIHSDPWRSWLFGWLFQHRSDELEVEVQHKVRQN
jgi:hypothetical protein